MDAGTTGTVPDVAAFAAGDWIIPALLTLLVLVISTVALFLYRRVAAAGNTVVIIGLNDSGKTVLYTKLINPSKHAVTRGRSQLTAPAFNARPRPPSPHLFAENKWSTYTSMAENVYEKYLSPKGHQFRLIDFPGSERLRRQLYSKWLAKVGSNWT